MPFSHPDYCRVNPILLYQVYIAILLKCLYNTHVTNRKEGEFSSSSGYYQSLTVKVPPCLVPATAIREEELCIEWLGLNGPHILRLRAWQYTQKRHTKKKLKTRWSSTF
jgi:hypothetical protein